MEVEAPKLKLTMEKGPLAGQSIEFKPGITVRVGRIVRGNNLTIKDSGVSSKHLTIEFNSDDCKWILRDLGSSNGTFLNDDKLDPSCPACLADSDVIKIGELTSIEVQIEDAKRGPSTKTRRNPSRRAATDAAANDAAENGELGFVSEEANRGSTRARRNPRRKAETDTAANDGGDAAENGELGFVSEEANRGSTRAKRNPRRNAGTDTATNDGGDAAENCELGLVGEEELGNNNKGKMKKPPRPRTRGKTQAQPEGIGLENAGIRVTRSSSKTENFDGGTSQVETGESLSVIEDENGDKRKTRNTRGRGSRELRNLVPIEQPLEKPKRVTRSKKQINLQAVSVTTVHLEEEKMAEIMLVSKEHAQCEVEAIQSREEEMQVERNNTVEEPVNFGEGQNSGSKKDENEVREQTKCRDETIQTMEEERQVEGYNTVEVPVNFGEGQNNGSNTSGAKKDENEVREQSKCQDEAIQTMEEDGQMEGNHTVEKEDCHGLPNVSGVNKGNPDIEEVNLETLTLGEWLDYLEISIPKQIIDTTEEMILEMRKKAEKLQEFMLHQKNAKE